MNFKNILNEIEQAGEGYEQVSDRRHMLKSFGSKVAIAAIPLAITSLFSNKAQAKTGATETVTDALNFALELAYFNFNFFHTGNSAGGLILTNNAGTNIGPDDVPGFITIAANAKAHIHFLNTAITSLGGVPYTPTGYNSTDVEPEFVPTAYDFTAGGAYTNVFASAHLDIFLMVAQAILDTTVRGLNGQLSFVLSNTTVLTQYLQMQATVARSASHTRLVRRYRIGSENPAPWITNDIAPDASFQTSYNGEANETQLYKITINTLPDKYDNSGVVPKISATAAFDEPLDIDTVKTFLKRFMTT